MATKEFPIEAQPTEHIETRFRRIQTPIPVPDSIPVLRQLRETEPRSMGGQPPVVWHTGDAATVSDCHGNRWIDFSCGVLVTSCGHNHPRIITSMQKMLEQGLYHAYCFPTAIRRDLIDEITRWLTPPLARVFLLTTGSEATECCIKLARTWGMKVGGKEKSVLVSFENAFHGRTMGAQLAGGWAGQKAWMGDLDPRFVQVPYPDGFRQKDTSFDVFERVLSEKGIAPENVCGVMSETYQGCNATIMPAPYAKALREWCDRHQAVLIYDEVQAGFGRTGAPFGFSHCGVVPDLVACGKGIAGGMPLSAVLGTNELMSMYGPGEMTSTHSANPVCAAAALANLQAIREDKLVENAAALAPALRSGLERIARAAGDKVGHLDAVGLVGALQFTKPGTTEPAPDWAWEMVWQAVRHGVLLFAPVGVGGSAVKINPPLTINADALEEGLTVLESIAREL